MMTTTTTATTTTTITTFATAPETALDRLNYPMAFLVRTLKDWDPHPN